MANEVAADVVPRSEEYVVQKVVEFFRAAGYRVVCEVPSMGQSIDVVATKGRWVMCIEVKLSDWRRGLGQCRAHRVVADHVVLAVASAGVPSALLSEADRHGIGLLHFSRELGVCNWALRPKRLREVWLPQRRRLSSAIREIAHGR